jgi:hypothetical protein
MSDTNGRDDRIVHFTRSRGDDRTAHIRFERFDEPHWSKDSGGLEEQKRPPRAYIHGYVWCNEIVLNGSEFGHSCVHGEAPHYIKVVAFKKDNTADVYAALVRAADASPRSRR